MQTTLKFLLPESKKTTQNLCGHKDSNLRFIESLYQIQVSRLTKNLKLEGPKFALQEAKNLLSSLIEKAQSKSIQVKDIKDNMPSHGQPETPIVTQKRYKKAILPKNQAQTDYLSAIETHPLVFAYGPAGTGKTYLAVAKAVEALKQGIAQRILIVRPVVEAGEKLGFLPGDIADKVQPYLRPIYDALYDLLGTNLVQKYINDKTIEIAPLAFMRGRTLNDAFIILDEAQNTTRAQMKMFLTRLGFGSTAIITGDLTQIDLPVKTQSGLVEALDVTNTLSEVASIKFSHRDVVRHPLVSKIIQAYDKKEQQ